MRTTLLTALVLGATALAPSPAGAIPAWARKYNMNCSGCHAPAVPRLNAKGFAFKWAGYRLPEEIGESQEVKQISDYIAARYRMRYVWRKTDTQPTSTNAFQFNDATVFAGGPIGKYFGAFLEFEHATDEVELVNNLYAVAGKEKNFVGARVGQMHWLLRGAVAGFDRPTGISTPTPLGNPLTSNGVPFAFGTDEIGGEAFYVFGRNRLSFEVLNGVNAAGKGDEGGSPNSKDVAAIDQLIYDEDGSGLTAVAYRGAVGGLDPAIDRTSHFTRLGISANKIYKGFEAMGGYVFARDEDLPIGAPFGAAKVTGSGYWAYAGYTLPMSLTLFSRYEYVDPNRDVTRNENRRFVFGSVLPVNLPEYLRFAAEYTLDSPRATGANKSHGLAAEAMLNF